MPNRLTHTELPSETDDKGRTTKKAQILSLYSSGMTDIEELSQMTESKPSYVASVLQDAGLLSGYFDLYTRSQSPMNVYSHFFSGQLGFKDEETAHQGVHLLERFYRQFREERDRAGQHHALAVALTMFDRARWCGKRKEAEVYKRWLETKLNDGDEGEPLVISEREELSRH